MIVVFFAVFSSFLLSVGQLVDDETFASNVLVPSWEGRLDKYLE
jgi:hypothetical protein